MKTILTCAFTALTLLLSFSANIITPYAQEVRTEKLTNQDLVEMTEIGFPETVILAKIKSS